MPSRLRSIYKIKALLTAFLPLMGCIPSTESTGPTLSITQSTPLETERFRRLRHSDADISRYVSFRGPSENEALLDVWRRGFLSAPTNRAFAVSETGAYGAAFGFGTEQEARELALRNCRRRADEQGMGGTCAVYAVNSRVVWPQAEWELPRLEQSVLGLAVRPEYIHRGPADARGLIIWSHGYYGRGFDQTVFGAHGYINMFNMAGWDVLRFDRHSGDDGQYFTILGRLQSTVLRSPEIGYRSIVLAGQSRGAWQSLEALHNERAAANVAAVIAAAPARHGEWQRNNNLGAALDDWRRLLTGIHENAATKVVVLVFNNDDFDPDPTRRAELARSILSQKRTPYLVIHETDPALSAHGAGGRPLFRERYGACLQSFIEGGTVEGACAAHAHRQ